MTADTATGRSQVKRALLEQRLRRAAGAPGSTTTSRIPRRPAGEPPPLSFPQERLWFMEQFAPGTAAYGVPLILRFGPDYDHTALRQALDDLMARHESLRMRFPATEDGRPTVAVDPPAGVPLPLLDVPGEEAARLAVAEASARPFDLATGPLLRAKVLRLAGGAEHAVLLDMHHIVTDGWSNEILLNDLAALYRAHRDGGAARLEELPVGYGDFASWQRERMAGDGAKAGVGYWLDQLRGVPVLELPADAPRPATQTYGGASEHFHLDADLVGGLGELGRRHRATLFMTMLAGYQALLAHYTRQTDFAVGSPVAGRSAPELDGVVGMFVNMLPLRCDLSGDPTVEQLIGRTRDAVLGALAHQDVPFEKVINDLRLVRDVSRPPLFQTMFVLQNYDRPDRPDTVGAGTDIGWQPVELPATRYDLELHAYAGRDGGLKCRFVSNTALFRPDTMARLAGHLDTLLRNMVRRPGAPVSDLELLGGPERALIASWNATDAPLPAGATLHGLVNAQARRTPDAVAVSDEHARLSYRELDAAANRVARRLRAMGVGPGSVVAVCAERSVELVTALLGVLEAGAAYLPLDPEYPAERLAYMLADSGAAVLLSQRRLAGTLPAAGPGVPVLMLDDERQWVAAPGTQPGTEPGPEPELPLPGSAAAYMIYTSGSTGRPKGVVNTHRGIVNRLCWMQEAFGLGRDDVVLQKTPASFDVSVWEFFWPLLAGARLVLARPGGHRDPDYLRAVIDRERVTTVHFVPSMLSAFLADGDQADADGADANQAELCRSLRRIVCSGEELPVTVAKRCIELIPLAQLHNLYGPTEAAVDVTAWHCTPAALAGLARVPIGAPIRNTRVHVLDGRLREVPIGVPGELHIGGVQVARGYHRRPELTAQRFVADPFGQPGERLYATGDLARWRPDGTVEFLGRLDDQVKVRGLRIELGEIEVVLREQPGVADAAVAVREPTAGDKRLVGYLVADRLDADRPDAAALREALKRRLPEHMVPQSFVAIDALPLSPNGKLDRARLPIPDLGARPDQEFVEPQTEIERAVAGIWAEVLGLDRVGVEDDFFAIGGHSLLATQVVAKLRRITAGTSAQVGVMDLFQHPTVRGLAALIEDSGDGIPRRLLYELTKPTGRRVCSYVCVPYGGGSAVVYQPIADAMPAGHALYSVAIPGHDVGLDEDALPFDKLVGRCATEVLERVEGPLVLYGHCGVGGALIVELARRLEAAGRRLEAVYVGGVFPFARPAGRLTRVHQWMQDRASNRTQLTWLKSMGVDMDELEPAQADRIISNMRRDSREAEEHFTALLESGCEPLRAPIISVVGERDPITDFYAERYREWRFVTDTAALVVLDEAGHFFLRYRAAELVEILTRTHRAIGQQNGQDDEPALPRPSDDPVPRWWLHGVARGLRSAPAVPDPRLAPSMRRFVTVSTGQLVSTAGSALTAWAIPIWVLQRTGSLAAFGITSTMAFLPMLLAMPVAGVVADRFDRRRVLMAAGCAAAGIELLFAGLAWTDRLPLLSIYPIVAAIGFAGTFQRVAFIASIPQLVPKRYLGHANGVAQLVNGFAMLFVPLLAAGLLAAIGLRGILLIDMASYAFAITVLSAVRFPDLLGRVRREGFGRALLGGLSISWGNRYFRRMLLFFAVGNLLYAGPMILVVPLVLAFDSLGGVARVALAEGLGAMCGGITVLLWGGPRRRRMLAILFLVAVAGQTVALAGLRPSLALVAVAMFGTGLALAVADGVYLTIIEVKVPQRFHARVIVLNQTLAWSTLPIGFAIALPSIGTLLEPLLADGGALAGSVGSVIGTGPGRGIGLAFVIFGCAMTANALLWLAFVRRLRRLDVELPDTLPDDLVGVEALKARESAEPAGVAEVAALAGMAR